MGHSKTVQASAAYVTLPDAYAHPPGYLATIEYKERGKVRDRRQEDGRRRSAATLGTQQIMERHLDFDADGKPTTTRMLKQDAYARAAREGCDVERTPEWQRAVEIEMQELVDEEVVRQILATSDADVLAGRWPPLVKSATDKSLLIRH
jgi:hypothetical protein